VPLEPLDGVPPPPPLDDDDGGEEAAELEGDDAPAEEEDAPAEEVEVVEVVEVVELVAAAGCEATVAVGTVSGGAPEVSVAGEPPPHAAIPTIMVRPAASPATRLSSTRRRGTAATSDVERLHAPRAMGAVVEILLAQLVAPVAEAQVLDRPGQLGQSRGER
jgi:hypothetical protein